MATLIKTVLECRTSVDDQHKLDFDMYTAGFNTRFASQSFDVAMTHIRYHDTYNENATQVYGQKDYIFSFVTTSSGTKLDNKRLTQ